jgi:hypothetical protein
MTHRPAVLLLALAACAAERPAHFADASVIDDVGDDRPIPSPKRFDPVKEAVLTVQYVERPMVEALDPSQHEGGDVNALDEVPRSTWFSPDTVEAAADAADSPAPPFRFLLDAPAVTHDKAVSVIDARGRRFEVWRDPPDRPGMATGAAAAAAQILREIGYFTPGVWANDLGASSFVVRDAGDTAALEALVRSGPPPSSGVFRVGITRWPIGTDIGPTPSTDVRKDDPNDRVRHEDRRTLRALKLVFGWLGQTQADASVLRDVYVGAPGRGHVVHYIAGLGGALGADAVVRPAPPRDDDTDLTSVNVWITLGTLGLYRQKPRLTPERWPSLGEYRETWAPEAFHTSPPIEPLDRALPADLYWAAKRIAALRTTFLVRALDAGHYDDDSARSLLQSLIRDRQRAAVVWGFAQVTPCEVERLAQPGRDTAAALVLRDAAVSLGVVVATSSQYRVDMVDDAGRAIAEPRRIELSGGALFPVVLPENAPGYVVIRVRLYRSGRAAPRSMEVHLVHRPGSWRVVGVVR